MVYFCKTKTPGSLITLRTSVRHMERVLLAALAALPFTVVAQEAPPFAQGGPDLTYVQLLVLGMRTVLDTLLPVVATLALLFYFWQMALFILRAGDPEARRHAVRAMAWGLVALFVLVGVWGIVAILAQMLGVPLGGAAPVPAIAP